MNMKRVYCKHHVNICLFTLVDGFQRITSKLDSKRLANRAMSRRFNICVFFDCTWCRLVVADFFRIGGQKTSTWPFHDPLKYLTKMNEPKTWRTNKRQIKLLSIKSSGESYCLSLTACG